VDFDVGERRKGFLSPYRYNLFKKSLPLPNRKRITFPDGKDAKNILQGFKLFTRENIAGVRFWERLGFKPSTFHMHRLKE